MPKIVTNNVIIIEGRAVRADFSKEINNEIASFVISARFRFNFWIKG